MLIDIGGEAAKLAVEKTTNAVSILFGSAAKEFGLALGEGVRQWRLENALRIYKKQQKIAAEHHIPQEKLRELTLSESFRAIEAASLEEDDNVQEMWASLLHNAHNLDAKVAIDKTYIDLLRSISGTEAIFLQALSQAITRFNGHTEQHRIQRKAWNENFDPSKVRQSEFPHFDPTPPVETILEEMNSIFAEWRKFELEFRNSAIQNLIRLRCISPRFSKIDVRSASRFVEVNGRLRGERVGFLDPQAMNMIIGEIYRRMEITAGIRDQQIPDFKKERSFLFQSGNALISEFMFAFTPLGVRLMKACSVPKPEDSSFKLDMSI